MHFQIGCRMLTPLLMVILFWMVSAWILKNC